MPSKVQTWLASLPDEAVEAELADLEAQAEALQREIAVRREVLEMKRRWQGAPAPSTNNRHAPAPPARRLADDEELPADEERPGRMRGKEAVLAVMRDKPESVWTLDALAEAMIARGWMDRTEDDRHALQVACSRMYRRKELRRMRPGVYRLHPRMRDIAA